MPYESHHEIDENSYLIRAVHRRGFGLSDFTIGEVLGIRHPSTTRWDDLRVPVNTLNFNGIGTDPETIAYKTSLTLRCFDATEALHFLAQIPHNYSEGTDLRVHVHWTPHSRGAAEIGKTVAWKVAYSVANMSGAFGNAVIADCTDVCDGVDDKHQRADSVTVDGSALTISAIIIGKVYRDSGDNWATNTAGNRPALLEVDFHYEIDSLGSVSAASKDAAGSD
jgi:hypothetical protein